jgi:hypothetical protein
MGSAPCTANLLSIDVDDYVLVCFAHYNTKTPIDSRYKTNIDYQMRSVLDLLSECNCKATFFVSTFLVDKYEGTLKRLVSDGHMIGSHGHNHYNFNNRSIQEFAADIKKSLEILARYQKKIYGYRPPAFTMPYDEEHFKILADHGIEYISSGVGVARSNAPHTNIPMTLAYGLTHIPISTTFMYKSMIKYPIGYGVTSRLLPERLYFMTLEHWRKNNSLFHYYAHPFEIAGYEGMEKKWLPREARNHATFLYYLRCRNRRDFFKTLFKRCQFNTIESYFLAM